MGFWSKQVGTSKIEREREREKIICDREEIIEEIISIFKSLIKKSFSPHVLHYIHKKVTHVNVAVLVILDENWKLLKIYSRIQETHK